MSRIRQGFLLLYYQKVITQNTPLVSSTSSNHKQDLVVECSYGGQEKNARITIVLHATEVHNGKALAIEVHNGRVQWKIEC